MITVIKNKKMTEKKRAKVSKKKNKKRRG